MATKDELIMLAREVCNNKALEQVEEWLAGDKRDRMRARILILGALDKHVFKDFENCKDMNLEEAGKKYAKKYKILGFAPEDANQIRQMSRVHNPFA